ncbi:hypothetical protein SDC9_149003 [bioreactor metagenome]|uniref:Uncharacterized protein n=1 Tax=bioreactor metagenome TaxID=1076179 RepID=A0A645EIM2_9ZZZZ
MIEITPIPNPPTIRQITKSKKEAEIAHPIADMENKTAEISMVTFLPIQSLNRPANITPTIEPINAQPTYHPSCILSK